MKNFNKLISFIIISILMIQCINLQLVFAEPIDIGYDEVVSESGIDVLNYNLGRVANESVSTQTQNIVLILDKSGSMGTSKMNTLKTAAKKFCEAVLNANPNNMIGIITFSSSETVYGFSNSIDDLNKNIDSISSGGSTKLSNAITKADKLIDECPELRKDVNSIIIMSDGDVDDKPNTKTEIEKITGLYKIFSVYLGNGTSAKNFMESIQNSGFYNAESVNDLVEQFGKIADVILNPLNLELGHECKYDFMTQKYTIRLIVSNPNDKDIHNVSAHINLPEGVEFESNTNQKADIELPVIKAYSNSANTIINETETDVVVYNPFVWYVEIFQETSDKKYNISVDVDCDEFSALSIQDTIYVKGYNTEESNQINIDEDTWQFANYSEQPVKVNNNAIDGLIQSISKSNVKQSILDFINGGSNGHCYGMSATVILNKMGAIFNDISNIHNISFEDINARETIGYYQVLQKLPKCWDETFNMSSLDTVAKLNNIANKARAINTGATPIMLIFSLDGGRHAVVAYNYIPNYEYTFNGIKYNSLINIYDCNYPNNSSFILMNSHLNSNNVVDVENDNFVYISYDNGNYIEPYNNISFDGAINDINIIDNKNIQNMENYNNAILRLKVGNNMSISEDNKVVATIDENGTFNSDIYFGAYDLSSHNNEKYYNIKLNKNSKYRLSNKEDNNLLNASMIYDNYYEAVETDNGKNIEFSPNGKVVLVGNVGKYTLGLTANSGYTSLPWYTVKVSGTGDAENPSLSIADDGYIFEGEELSNITVLTNNDNETKELTFDSDKTSVLITNDNDNLIIKEDTDGDGEYETPIADSDNKIIISDETTTETTTTAKRPSSGGGSYKPATTTTTTDATTEITTEKATETTTSDNDSKDVRVSIGSSEITVGNKSYAMDAAAYIQPSSNSTMVPLRFVSIAILNGDITGSGGKGSVDWDAKTKTASIIVKNGSGSHIIQFTAGSDKMVIDGTSITMENGVVAEIKDSRMYVPFRALGTALGVGVKWDGTTRTASYLISK